jgi:hypothetical protein
MGFGEAFREEEGDRVQIGVQEKGTSIEKMGEKFNARLVEKGYSQ